LNSRLRHAHQLIRQPIRFLLTPIRPAAYLSLGLYQPSNGLVAYTLLQP